MENKVIKNKVKMIMIENKMLGCLYGQAIGDALGFASIPKYYIENLYDESAYRKKVNHFISIALNETE